MEMLLGMQRVGVPSAVARDRIGDTDCARRNFALAAGGLAAQLCARSRL